MDPNRPRPAAPPSCTTIRFPYFRNVHETAGIDFRFDNGDDARQLMVLSTAGGCGWLDYDNDGQWDLFVAQGGDPAPPPPGHENQRPPDRLYRNRGDGTFEDVSLLSGLGDRAVWSTSAAWADLDQDGYLDLYVCNYVKYDPYRPTPRPNPNRPGLDREMADCGLKGL